jgi:hypothetical protein
MAQRAQGSQHAHPANPAGPQRRGFLHNLKWMFILWCVGFGATVLLTLPFHFLVEAMMHK